jgi:hypothetical protein
VALKYLQEPKRLQSIRPNDIKSQLPENLTVRTSELSNIMKSLTKTSILERPVKDAKKWKSRGKAATKNQNLPGPNMSYKQTEFEVKLKALLGDAKLITKVHLLLLDSHLLYQLLVYIKLVAYWVMRNNQQDRGRAWSICKSVFPLNKRESSFERDFEKVTAIQDKNELETLASNWAVSYLGKHLPEDYYSLFYSAAFYF